MWQVIRGLYIKYKYSNINIGIVNSLAGGSA